MRDIEFRGQRVYDDKWIYGSLIIDNQGEYHIFENIDVVQDGHHVVNHSDTPMFFKQETIGQYTGLTDKNGKKIFEGDIIHIAIWARLEKPIAEENAIVVFENGRFGMHRGYDWHLTSFDSFCDTTFEIIGNLHDNPELMKGGEE